MTEQASTIPTLPRWISQPPPTSIQWELITNTQSFTSPLSGQTQVLSQPGTRWHATLDYSLHGEVTIRDFTAFILSLEGPKNQFIFTPPHAQTPKGHAKGTPIVHGEQQKGSKLITSGWQTTEGTHPVMLKKGDYITISLANGQISLHSLKKDARTNRDGIATLDIVPALRSPPKNKSPIITDRPVCIMRLADDKQSSFSIEKNSHANSRFELMESYP